MTIWWNCIQIPAAGDRTSIVCSMYRGGCSASAIDWSWRMSIRIWHSDTDRSVEMIWILKIHGWIYSGWNSCRNKGRKFRMCWRLKMHCFDFVDIPLRETVTHADLGMDHQHGIMTPGGGLVCMNHPYDCTKLHTVGMTNSVHKKHDTNVFFFEIAF